VRRVEGKEGVVNDVGDQFYSHVMMSSEEAKVREGG
jgi:hypothetical protein